MNTNKKAADNKTGDMNNTENEVNNKTVDYKNVYVHIQSNGWKTSNNRLTLNNSIDDIKNNFGNNNNNN